MTAVDVPRPIGLLRRRRSNIRRGRARRARSDTCRAADLSRPALRLSRSAGRLRPGGGSAAARRPERRSLAPAARSGSALPEPVRVHDRGGKGMPRQGTVRSRRRPAAPGHDSVPERGGAAVRICLGGAYPARLARGGRTLGRRAGAIFGCRGRLCQGQGSAAERRPDRRGRSAYKGRNTSLPFRPRARCGIRPSRMEPGRRSRGRLPLGKAARCVSRPTGWLS